MAIHILQLPKWKYDGTVRTEKDRWIYLFKEGKNTDPENPPEILATEEMRQVMKVMHRFSENERDYLLYQSRRDAILTQNTWLRDIEEAERERDQAVREKEAAVKAAVKAAVEAAVKEKEAAVEAAVKAAVKKGEGKKAD